MALEIVTLHLPDTVMRRAQQAAHALQRPLEEVLTTVLAASLPNIDDAPPEMQAELNRMTWLSDQELWSIARAGLPEEDQRRLRRLTELLSQRPLTEEEQTGLDALRQEYGRVTLRKARAYALLSLRGGRPLLAGK